MADISSFDIEVNAALERLLSSVPRVKAAVLEKREIPKNDVLEKNTTAHAETECVSVGVKTEKKPFDAVNRRENGGGSSRIISLASGSRANCTLVEAGGTRILIDFGLSCRMLSGFLKPYGLDIADVDAVFITHEHTDHVYGLSTLLKKYDIPVHMTEPSYLAYTRKSGFEYRDKITVHEVEFKEEIGGFTVSSCEISHDSAACVSYLVEGNGVSFCTCTDLGFVPERVFRHISRAENVILESNHDVDLLDSGEYPFEVKQRIKSRFGHLSNEQCAEILVRLVEAGVKRVLLGHVSPENNDPDIAWRVSNRALECARVNIEYLDTAPRLEPKVLWG